MDAKSLLINEIHLLSSPATELIRSLDLQPHFEGGYFKQTEALNDNDQALLATQIYYLLTPQSWRGKMHMNMNATFHTHHSGRARYTLIRPSPDGPPEVKQVVIGANGAAGEVLQLYVPGGWWKSSELLEKDLSYAQTFHTEEAASRVGCLISEVVVPGWTPSQHKFMDADILQSLFPDADEREGYERFIAPPASV